MAGSSVMLTPNGLLVRVRHLRISARSPSASGKMSAVMRPRPPALDTALAISAVPTCWGLLVWHSGRKEGETCLHATLHNGDCGPKSVYSVVVDALWRPAPSTYLRCRDGGSTRC